MVARRLLKSTGLDSLYPGNTKINGDDYNVEINEERRPFKAVLDVGLTRTTTGNKVFAVLKGATDGGLNVPHSNKRFPGFKSTDKGETYNAKAHRDRIFGLHVDKYIKTLKKGDPEDYKLQFSRWEANLQKLKVDNLEKLYTKIHEEIRKNPDRVKAPAKDFKLNFTDKRKTIIQTSTGKYKKDRRLTYQERKDRVNKKIQKAAKGGK